MHARSFRQLLLAAAGFVVTGLVAQQAAYGSSILNQFNLITTGDFTTTSGVYGATLIGGNITGSNAKDFNTSANVYVVGDVAGGDVKLNNGSKMFVGGSVTAKVLNGQVTTGSSEPASFGNIGQQLTAASDAFKNLAANSSVSLPSGSHGPVNFSVPSGMTGTAVFNIAAADLFSNGFVQQIDFATGDADTVVVNVSGTNVTFNSGNFVGSSTNDSTEAKVIWNFYEATSINLQRTLRGSLLAPLAAVTFNSQMEGTVAARTVDAKGQIHPAVFGGTVPQTPEGGLPVIPEPLAATSILVLMGGLATRRRA